MWGISIIDKSFNEAISNFNLKLRTSLMNIDEKIKKNICEICIRVNKNTIVETFSHSYFLANEGKLSCVPIDEMITTPYDIKEIFKLLSNYIHINSQAQFKLGYLTLKGGHRIGFGASAVILMNEIVNISDISSINLRIAREIKGCANEIFKLIGQSLSNTLIIGPYACGKTTILRDIARQISEFSEENFKKNKNKVKKVTIVDEKCEIAASNFGIPNFDIGFSDVLNGFPNIKGMIQAVSTLRPDIIIMDDINFNELKEKFLNIKKNGIGLIFTTVGNNLNEIILRSDLNFFLKNEIIEKIILLDSKKFVTKIKAMYNVKKNIFNS